MRCPSRRSLWIAALLACAAGAGLGCGPREAESQRAIRLTPAEPLLNPHDLEDLVALIPPMPAKGEPLPAWPIAPRAPTGDPLRDARQRERELEILRHRLAGIELGIWKCADDIVWSNLRKRGPQMAAEITDEMPRLLSAMIGSLLEHAARLRKELAEREASEATTASSVESSPR